MFISSYYFHMISKFPLICLSYLFRTVPEWSKSCPVNELQITVNTIPCPAPELKSDILIHTVNH